MTQPFDKKLLFVGGSNPSWNRNLREFHFPKVQYYTRKRDARMTQPDKIITWGLIIVSFDIFVR